MAAYRRIAMSPVNHKIMTFRLAADGFYDGRVQCVAAAVAHFIKGRRDVEDAAAAAAAAYAAAEAAAAAEA